MPESPHSDDGMRIEPPVSEPSAPGHMPAATEAPEPDDDPPQMRCVALSHGFRGAPWCGLSPSGPKANSCMFNLPRTTPPAAASRVTTVASSSGNHSARIFEPPVVLTPFVQ